ncbi:MAG: hypothetical protein QMD05_05795 [Candidatus Brocadiaceae bacterium]|nr:hypothetical protein [Candidatus Brocadiaceae bacterium]
MEASAPSLRSRAGSGGQCYSLVLRHQALGSPNAIALVLRHQG